MLLKMVIFVFFNVFFVGSALQSLNSAILWKVLLPQAGINLFKYLIART